ncbi:MULTISPECIES: PfkB family carbohydrate kinase [Sphingobacterium]|jgi:sugar/nucleoside kinase (ribokinase family)|uniref:PfkB family carbohydrate kinase n=1 Tax=Sphingobacterium TaxID=28453 RepID=UPI0004E5FB4C|nr:MULTISPECIES: PfkB family carbohydrate kinase [Sphingobacterium]UPZ36681.1 PfkB family carbohydrate kinase [Sphingobacterium sp. PCS056]UXD68198.1 PfkB family carbohydrate kinase [Sphingobacterium faecium]WGQ15909.1 PfkB family carbohydrate kinase [Sphingobacterium faecium]CDT05282.1 PfkB family carbohydrate kinase [Sphingobacterium sp. PM2-P1-29]
MSLVVMGTVAFDAIETPFGKTDKIVGGAGTFAALSASFLYDQVKLVGVIGEDFGDDNLNIITSKGVDVEGIQIIEGGKSFFWAGKYHNDMNSRDTITTELNVLENFDPIIPESYQDCEFLLLGNATPQVQMTTLNRLKNKPKLVVLDTMNFWMDIAMDDLKAVLKHVDVLTINDGEARQLSGEYSLVKAAAVILEMGPKYLIIKKGEHGALLFGEGQIFSAPALPLAEVFDPTGAGDAFAGGFIGYLAKVKTINFTNMKNAVVYGSALASFCVEKFGTERLQTLTQEEIEARLKAFVSLAKFDI